MKELINKFIKEMVKNIEEIKKIIEKEWKKYEYIDEELEETRGRGDKSPVPSVTEKEFSNEDIRNSEN